MPAISFSAKEILKGLLEHTKTQTIRLGDKPARIKIGDFVTLYWKQRGKANVFCKCHGAVVGRAINSNDGRYMCTVEKGKYLDYYNDVFHKMMGKVRITDVFQIEMFMDDGRIGLCCDRISTYPGISQRI